MDSTRIEALQALASEVRKDIVRMVGVARSGYIVTPLSVTDVLVYLYWEAMVIHPENCWHKDRDRFFLGMCAATPSLYAVLARRGYFDREELWHYKRLGAMLQPLPGFGRVPGIEAPCILSASELSLVAGCAELLNADDLGHRFFCLIGKEDCINPGFWAEVENVGGKKLHRIVLLVIVPINREEVGKETVVEYAKRFVANGWKVDFADGHDFADMERSFGMSDAKGSLPAAVFVSTLIGKGLSIPETQKAKNSKLLSLQEMDRALEELENGG